MMILSPKALIVGPPNETRSILHALAPLESRCMGAFHVEHARSLLRCTTPKVVAIDVSKWPEGWRIVEQIREIPRYTPQILIMAYGLTLLERKLAAQFRITRWVIKPFNSTAFMYEILAGLEDLEYWNPGSIGLEYIIHRTGDSNQESTALAIEAEPRRGGDANVDDRSDQC
jgi:hypothetical protein